MDPILVDDRGDGILVISLNRPDKRNALDFKLLEALSRTLLELGDHISAVILRGSGGEAFSAGFDFNALTGTESDLEADATIGRASAALSGCPVPVIAQLDRHCHGAAVELALNCDLRVASDDLEMSLRAVGLGVVYRTQLLIRLVDTIGLGRTQDLLFGMPVLDAEKALAWGLVSEVVPAGHVQARVEAIAAGLALAPGSAVRGTKATLTLIADSSASAAVITAAHAWRHAAAGSDERKRALAAARTKLRKSARR